MEFRDIQLVNCNSTIHCFLQNIADCNLQLFLHFKKRWADKQQEAAAKKQKKMDLKASLKEEKARVKKEKEAKRKAGLTKSGKKKSKVLNFAYMYLKWWCLYKVGLKLFSVSKRY